MVSRRISGQKASDAQANDQHAVETPELRPSVQQESQAKVDGNHPDAGSAAAKTQRELTGVTLVQEERIRARERELETMIERARMSDQTGREARTRERVAEQCRAFQFSEAASGKAPDSIAAAAVYVGGLLTEDDVTQETVADAAGVSAATIRELYPVLVEAAWDDDVDPLVFKSDVERVVTVPEDTMGDRRRPRPVAPTDDPDPGDIPALPPEQIDADGAEGSEP